MLKELLSASLNHGEALFTEQDLVSERLLQPSTLIVTVFELLNVLTMTCLNVLLISSCLVTYVYFLRYQLVFR